MSAIVKIEDYLRQPLHLLSAGEVRDRRVSPYSKWADPKWRFHNPTAGASASIMNWAFEIDEKSRFTGPQWAELLEDTRRFLWSVLSDNQRGKSIKPGTLSNLADAIRYLIRWMTRNNYAAFAEIDPEAAEEFLEDLIEDKARSDEEGDGVTSDALHKYPDLLIRIFDQAPALASTPSAAMSEHPFRGMSANAIGKKATNKVTQRIPPVPDPVFLAITPRVMQWLEAPARDMKRLSALYWNGFRAAAEKRHNSYSNWINRELRGFVFDDAGELDRPWRAPLTDRTVVKRWFAGHGARESEWSLIQQYRHLLEDLRDACVIALQAFVGVRISEVCGLRAHPRDPETDWPHCVTVKRSRSGLNEIFHVRGRVYKTAQQWDDVEWVAGSRPVGTDHVPPPIRALLILDWLYEPWRRLSDRPDLILSFPSPYGLPRSKSTIGRITANALRHGQKEFVREYVVLPPGYESWNLTTHQWRKSFALYMVRSDERLLPAVSAHFKHVSLAMTEQGYVGDDAELLGIMDEVATREAARLIHGAVTGRDTAAGRMAEKLAEQKAEILALLKGETDEEQIEALTDTLRDDDVRVWSCDWGQCFFRSETARCHHLANGAFNLAARMPHYGKRNPGVCCDCANLLVSDEHVDFWKNRHAENLSVYEANRAVGIGDMATVAAERVRKSAVVLRKLGIVMDALKGMNDNAT